VHSHRLIPVLVAGLAAACWVGPLQDGRVISREKAKEVSDAFMQDLVNDPVDLALEKMEPEFVNEVGRIEAEAGIRKLFDYCGRPLDSEFRHDEIGFKLYMSGRQKPMRKFFYAGSTTVHPGGHCFFTVEVVPEGQRMMVTLFGPLKLLTGQLPEWAREDR